MHTIGNILSSSISSFQIKCYNCDCMAIQHAKLFDRIKVNKDNTITISMSIILSLIHYLQQR